MGHKDFFKINRREFIKYCTWLTSVIGLTSISGKELALAIEQEAAKPPLIWIEAQDCGGCLQSAMNSAAPTFSNMILDLLSVKYQPQLMFDSDKKAMSQIDDVTKAGRHVLVVSGSIPLAEDGIYCRPLSDKSKKPISIRDAIEEIGKNASAVLALGTCSSFGGIPSAVKQFRVTKLENLFSSKAVINIPGCPPHPDWVLGTIINMLLFDEAPKVDNLGRPELFFGETVHDNCSRRGRFESGKFATDLGDTENCFYKLGCKGPNTFADCPKRKWNDNVNWCIQANSLCIGCASPRFYDGLSPLSAVLPEVDMPLFGKQQVDDIGKFGVIATGAGIGAHYGWTVWNRYKSKKEDKVYDLNDKTKDK